MQKTTISLEIFLFIYYYLLLVFMSINIIPFRVANIIYLESDENNPASVFSLYIFMFNFVKI